MKIRIVVFLCIYGAIGIGYADAQSQFVWHLSHTDFDGRQNFCFDAVSCYGKNCTAGGTIIDNATQRITRMFWRSNDGGISWQIQNPLLPSYTSLVTKHYFSVIQQIDSLNIIAGGDSGYVVRSTDAGNTWVRQDCKTTGIIRDIHFSDSLTGIILAQENFGVAIGAGAVRIHTTTDGGKKWVTSSFSEFNPKAVGDFARCHSYGNGKFRVFKSYIGPIYTTSDDWQTIDSSKRLVDSTIDASYKWYSLRCNFSFGDTIIAFGSYSPTGKYTDNQGIRFISFDGGRSWGDPTKFVSVFYGSMSSIDQDTILAGLINPGKVFVSTDRGTFWNVDSITLDTNYEGAFLTAITMTGNREALGIYSNSSSVFGTPSILIRAENSREGVLNISIPPPRPHLYPNPAATVLNLVGLDPSRPIHIIDIFGREVMKGVTNDQGTQIMDISILPHGIYDVLLDRNGRLLVAGKVAVTGK